MSPRRSLVTALALLVLASACGSPSPKPPPVDTDVPDAGPLESNLVIQSSTPSSGPIWGGTGVTIIATGLQDGQQTRIWLVELDGRESELQPVTAAFYPETKAAMAHWRLSFQMPAHEGGTVSFRVQPARGASSTLPQAFTFRVAEPTSNGLRGAYVSSFAPSPTGGEELLVATRTGSVLQVAGWTGGERIGHLDVGNQPPRLARHPLQPSRVYAAAQGLHRSDDGGRTWQRLGTEPLFSGGIVLDPRDAQTLYGATPAGLVKSTDGGATFAPLGAAANVSATGIELDPVDPRTLYAATRTQGVLRSTDGGVTWTPFNEGLPSVDVSALALGASTVSGKVHLYAVVDSRLLYKREADSAWKQLLAPEPSAAFRGVLAVSQRDARAVSFAYGPTLSSTRDATASTVSWNVLPLGERRVAALALGAPNADSLFVGFDGDGVWFGSDTGQRLYETGPEATHVHALIEVRVSQSASMLYAATSGGLFKAPASNRAFWYREELSPEVSAVYDVAVAPQGWIFIATSSGVLRKWGPTTRGTGQPSSRARFVTVDPLNGNVAYAGYDAPGLYKTTDGGESWARVEGLPLEATVSALRVDPSSPLRIYALAGGRSYRSGDAGLTWEDINPLASQEGSVAPFLALDPHTPTTLYATRGAALSVSADRGSSWRFLTSVPAHTDSLVLDTGKPGQFYALSRAGFQLWNGDPATPWSRVVPLSSEQPRVTTMLRSTEEPWRVLIGTEGLGRWATELGMLPPEGSTHSRMAWGSPSGVGARVPVPKFVGPLKLPLASTRPLGVMAPELMAPLKSSEVALVLARPQLLPAQGVARDEHRRGALRHPRRLAYVAARSGALSLRLSSAASG